MNFSADPSSFHKPCSKKIRLNIWVPILIQRHEYSSRYDTVSYSQVSNRGPPSPTPHLFIFRKFSTHDILILHPPFTEFWKMLQPGARTYLNLKSKKNQFIISPEIFRHRLSFVRISEFVTLYCSF